MAQINSYNQPLKNFHDNKQHYFNYQANESNFEEANPHVNNSFNYQNYVTAY